MRTRFIDSRQGRRYALVSRTKEGVSQRFNVVADAGDFVRELRRRAN